MRLFLFAEMPFPAKGPWQHYLQEMVSIIIDGLQCRFRQEGPYNYEYVRRLYFISTVSMPFPARGPLQLAMKIY